MKRTRKVTTVSGKQNAAQFLSLAVEAVTQAIESHRSHGIDSYTMHNGKIVARKPDGRLVRA